MAKLERKTIGLLFLGGATIDERGRAGETVSKEKDVKPWLRNMSEMDIIADTEGIFIASGLAPVGLADWTAAATIIADRHNDFDGFVLIHQLETVPAAAAVLSLMLRKLETPVVLCGSPLLSPAEKSAGLQKLKTPETGEYGAKATFINAVQVAVSDIAEVAAVYGSHIYRGSSVMGPMTGLQGVAIGKIDFGIRFFGDQIRRAKRGFIAQTHFDHRVAVAEYLPGLDLRHMVDQAKHQKAMFISSPDGGAVLGAAVAQIVPLLPNDFPVVIFGPNVEKLNLAPNVLPMSGTNRTVAILRVMWALGQTQDKRKLRKLLTTG